jgi:two-component system, sensor histidine kinase PdtaS
MALIHKNLYQHDDLSGIKVSEYLNDLLKAVSGTYHSRNRKVEVVSKAPDMLLDIDTAVPVGLIINELVSNAYKYAFPNGQEGVITVEVDVDETGSILLKVSDNGVGIPADFNVEQSSSLGLRLVNILNRQLEGEISVSNTPGATFSFKFKSLNQRKQED